MQYQANATEERKEILREKTESEDGNLTEKE